MNENESQDIVIYTDGGCSGNPGPGGWGCVILADGQEIRKSGGEKLTTNNRMELTAVITALGTLLETTGWSSRPVTLSTDSQYVKNGITLWIKNWKKNGWRTADKKPVKNQDLWIRLDELVSHVTLQWNWVKGHAGIKYNEVCDQLAGEQIRKFS